MRDIVAFYRDQNQARQARDELIAAGFESEDVRLHDEGYRSGGTTGTAGNEPGLLERIKEWFGFADESDRHVYAEATRRGHYALTVRVPDDADDDAADQTGASADSAITILRRHDPIDLDQESARWQSEGWAGTPLAQTQTTATSQAVGMPGSTRQTRQQQQPSQRRSTTPVEGEQRIPVAREELQVGKRAVRQGGVRIHSHVTEQPVEEQVELRTEKVNVERRPVNRPATGDENAFQERVVEATETSEQPVVSKQARVVEEVAVRKDVDQRTETVRDTVRRTDVDVERLNPGQQGGAGATDDDERLVGEFGSELAGDRRYTGKDWDTIESDARSSFERRNPGRAWERVKDGVRRAFDRSRSRSGAR